MPPFLSSFLGASFAGGGGAAALAPLSLPAAASGAFFLFAANFSASFLLTVTRPGFYFELSRTGFKIESIIACVRSLNFELYFKLTNAPLFAFKVFTRGLTMIPESFGFGGTNSIV